MKTITSGIILLLFLFFQAFSLPAQESNKVPLNNGKKWKTDAAMLQHIRSMQESLRDFPGEKIKSVDELQKTLQSEIQLLVESCSMKGKAHDALHEWLHPFIEKVKSLETIENTDAPEIKSLRKHLSEFDNYFE